MSFRDLRRAEEALFGGPTYTMYARKGPPGGVDRPKDIAQAFLNGDTEKVEAYVSAHQSRVQRAREQLVTPKIGRPRLIDWDEVLGLYGQGFTPSDIARTIGFTVSAVWKIIERSRAT